MIEAVLRVHLPCSWVTLLTVQHGAVVNVVEQKALENGILQSLVEIDPGNADPDELLDALRKNRDIVSVEAIVPRKGKILATLQVKGCRACHALSESECFLTDATAGEEGGLDWHLLAPDRDAVRDLLDVLKERSLEAEVRGIRSARAKGLLTDRQASVMGLAYKLGYYDLPKKINLSQLARKLGVSKSTLSEMLRLGEAKILHTYFHGIMRKSR